MEIARIFELGQGQKVRPLQSHRILDLAIPSIPLVWHEGEGTLIVPGHGRPCTEADVVEYRDMVTIIRDRVEDMKTRGLTLEQVKANNPTAGWRGWFGTDSGPWTTDKFVEGIYKSLPAKSPRRAN